MTDTSSSSIRSICVYCGSSPGNDPDFSKHAEMLGQQIAAHGMRLIYGGGDRGLMGAVARATIESGGQVTGIIPEFLKHMEQSTGTLGLDAVEIVTVPDMHTRKQMMFEQSDAFVAMPGGIGTLEELVEILTWAQLDRHRKPIAMLNVNDFWSPYMELMNHMDEAGFLHNPERVRPLIFDSADAVVPGILEAV